jgi:hypothetical protein
VDLSFFFKKNVIGAKGIFFSNVKVQGEVGEYVGESSSNGTAPGKTNRTGLLCVFFCVFRLTRGAAGL